MSPGQSPEEGWQSCPRLETLYAKPIRQLMATEHEDDVMSLWALGSGWAGLIRALFIVLRPEQDERLDDPEHAPFRLARINEKWGLLDIRSAGHTTRYQDGVTDLIECISAWVCFSCGQPGELRYASWVRPACDSCWAQASPDERADHERFKPENPDLLRDWPPTARDGGVPSVSSTVERSRMRTEAP